MFGKTAVNERALPAASDAGDDGKNAFGNLHCDVAEIVECRVLDEKMSFPRPRFLFRRLMVRKVFSRQRVTFFELFERTFEHNRSTGPSGAWPHVDDVISNRHHFRLVFHDENCVSDIAKLGQSLIESLDVVRVQTDRRLIEDVERLGQARRQMAHHLDPLRFSTGQCRGLTTQTQITKSDLDEMIEPF
jgi:hypothetical protein